VVRTISETRELLEGAMNEVAALAAACGRKLPEDAVQHALAELDRGLKRRSATRATFSTGGPLSLRPRSAPWCAWRKRLESGYQSTRSYTPACYRRNEKRATRSSSRWRSRNRQKPRDGFGPKPTRAAMEEHGYGRSSQSGSAGAALGRICGRRPGRRARHLRR
jgi:hypothetical protein